MSPIKALVCYLLGYRHFNSMPRAKNDPMSDASTQKNDVFLPYMRDVVRSEHSLRELNLMWRMIESSAKMNYLAETRSILQTMAATRAGFDQLEHELVSSLVHEKCANVLMEIGTKAHYVIDIVVRNLYERT